MTDLSITINPIIFDVFCGFTKEINVSILDIKSVHIRILQSRTRALKIITWIISGIKTSTRLSLLTSPFVFLHPRFLDTALVFSTH